MKYDKSTIILPLPTDELIKENESSWKISLPEKYKSFIKTMNGVEPIDVKIAYNSREEYLEKFLCMLPSVEDQICAKYDIDGVFSPMIEYMVYDEDCTGIQVLPIARLRYGNYIALDYKYSTTNPTVCVYDVDFSKEFEPMTYKIADNFEAFIEMLKS